MSHEVERARESLRELGALTVRTQRAGRAVATGFPLIGWGIAWILALGALDLSDGVPRIVAVALAFTVGMLLSWWPVRDVVRTGAESRMRVAWVVVLVASPLLATAARPVSFTYGVLLVSAVWGLAMCLYGVATADRALAVVAGSGVATAGVLSGLDVPTPLLWYGLGAGTPLLALGVLRVVRGAGRG